MPIRSHRGAHRLKILLTRTQWTVKQLLMVSLLGSWNRRPAFLTSTANRNRAGLDQQKLGKTNPSLRCIASSVSQHQTLLWLRNENITWFGLYFFPLQVSGGDVNKSNMARKKRKNNKNKDKVHATSSTCNQKGAVVGTNATTLFSASVEIHLWISPGSKNIWCGALGLLDTVTPSSPLPSLMGSRKSRGDCCFSRQGKEGGYAVRGYFYI